jgi:hypothetical protein
VNPARRGATAGATSPARHRNLQQCGNPYHANDEQGANVSSRVLKVLDRSSAPIKERLLQRLRGDGPWCAGTSNGVFDMKPNVRVLTLIVGQSMAQWPDNEGQDTMTQDLRQSFSSR